MRRAVVLIALLLAGCGVPVSTGNSSHSGSLSYLALGDDYTIGDRVAPALRWPVQLANLLRVYEVPVDDPTIVANTQWTAGDLASALEKAEIGNRFDLVTLMIGFNDAYRGEDPETFRGALHGLIESSVRHARNRPGRVLVLSLPDWSVTPHAANLDRASLERRITTYNDVIREEVAGAGVRYVDITTFSRTAADHPDLISGDGLHPSGMMHAEWARIVVPVARGALGK